LSRTGPHPVSLGRRGLVHAVVRCQISRRPVALRIVA
jgi:hypothetical protein